MKEKILSAFEEAAKKSTSSVFAVAVMDDDGISAIRPTPSNYANDFYSVAKTFTAVGILVLIDQGKLDPDEKIYNILKKYYPNEYDRNWEEVTVAHCLNHRMGIGEGFLDIDVEDQLSFGDDWLDYTFSTIKLPHTPGSDGHYSDGAFYLLSRIVAEVSGVEASKFIDENVLNPLEFRDHAWTKDPQGYAVGASGLYASAEDAVKLAWLYVNDGKYKDKQILKPETIELACRRNFGLSKVDDTEIYWKGGMNGQMLIADRAKRRAISWHTFSRDGVDDKFIDIALEAE